MATLEQFLKTGQLHPIGLGMTPFEVESLLGEPSDESRKKNPLVPQVRRPRTNILEKG